MFFNATRRGLSANPTNAMHKARKKAAMDARLLKPSISGERLEYEEAADRAVKNGSRLDLNAPLLSVRINRSEVGTASDAHETQHASLHNAGVNCCSSNLGNVSRRPLIPFFTWELAEKSAQESPETAPKSPQIEEQSAASESKGEEFVHPAPRVLAPPPRQQQIEPNQKNRGANWDFLEARSEVEIAQTEANSVAPSYRVSMIDGEGNEDLDEECDEALISYNACDRDILLRRFLPAATAVAKEMACSLQQQQQDDPNVGVCEIWKPLAIHPPQSPAPQDRNCQRELAELKRKITTKKKKIMLSELFSSSSSRSFDQHERKKFGELIRMRSQEEFEELDEIGEGASCSSQSGAVGGIICGFFPVIRMLRSNCSRPQEPSVVKSKERDWRKLEPQQQRGEDDHRHQNRRSWEPNGDGSSTEWWSDEGEQDHEEFEDANDSWRQNCRYTPSRGGLKSPAMPESKGFLGMPRDRIVGKTFIKRMYPVNLENVATTASDLKISRNSTNIHGHVNSKQRIDDVADSDSSDSLRSIKLDKCSSVSRQSSSNGGSMEKVFCLDTLNQVRESGLGAANHHDQLRVLKHSRSSRQSNSINNGGSSDHMGDFVEESAQILYTPHRSRKLHLLKSLRPDEHEEQRLSEQLRICWHDHKIEDRRAEASVAHPNLILPTPRGPSQSWLKKTIPNKPPLGKKNQPLFFSSRT